MKKAFVLVLVAGVLAAGIAHAAVIADRQAIMKEKAGASIGVLVKIARGEAEYDPATVLAALQTMRQGTEGYETLFPEGSDTGDTAASPKIWEDMEGFKAALDKLHADLDVAIAAAPADKNAFMPILNSVGENCSGCHDRYRLEKN